MKWIRFIVLILSIGALMAKTSPIVLFGENALAIKEDIASITVIQGGIQSFADINDLQTEVVQNRYATYEPDFWLLDGSYKFMPAVAHVGYMSIAQSASNTNFTAPVPEIRIIFNGIHSTNGIVLHFSELDWSDSVTIDFYDASNALIRSDTYTPSSAEFATNQAVSNFKRIDIFFNSTNKAYRFARLTGVDFDTLARFTGTDIKDAQVIEDVNPLSIEVPSNTFNVTLHSTDGDFSIVNPAGIYANLREGQPFDVYEQLDDNVLHIGKFYLDHEGWESLSATDAKFQCSDLLGLLDKIPYRFIIPSLVIFVNWNAGDILSEILDNLGIAYTIDSDLSSTVISGYIPNASVREALQHILFAAGGYVTCSRSSILQFRKLQDVSDIATYDYILTVAEKGIESPLKLKPLVTGVEITAHTFTPDGLTTTVVYSASLAVGTYTITFDEPHYFFAISAGSASIVSYTGNEVVINVTGAGTVTITAAGYIDSQIVYGIYNNNLPSGTTPNVVRITDATMVYPAYAQTVAQRVYDYYQQRYLQKTKLFAPSMAVGDSAFIDVQSGKHVGGITERMTIDLAQGMTAETEIIGTVLETTNTLYAGKYNDTNSKITYTGNFTSYAADGGAYSGDIHYVGDGLTGSAQFSFIGTRFKFIYRQSASQGSVQIYIDGQLITTINQAGSTVNQKEWDSGALSGIYHTVQIAKVGTTGVVNLDAIEIF